MEFKKAKTKTRERKVNVLLLLLFKHKMLIEELVAKVFGVADVLLLIFCSRKWLGKGNG